MAQDANSAESRSPEKSGEPGKQLPSIDNEVTQEVRFAVVMYGGVSLCIYINGIAQELLELSRVTTFDGNGKLLHATSKGAGSVYRRIAQYLDSDSMDSQLLKEDSDASIRTRFIVDILSGTSAGGLNSLFLAKALANDQDMEGLRHLWMEEGEITRLLNDQESLKGEVRLGDTNEPGSLLNSQLMYKKLLTALDLMDFPASDGQGNLRRPQNDEKCSPHVNDLDCFITTTDLTGLPIQLKLYNTVANEQRHRNVFRFRYRGMGSPIRNDFAARHNPFLAFAGRCTSAFPFAFEPMRLADIEAILPCWDRYNPKGEEREKLRDEWARSFYRDYINAGCAFDSRSFGDGGYLDNKPFSYATSTLMRRRAVLPVKRKLLYIEPSPEPPKDESNSAEKPDFISNSTAALISLPRYETIREDVEAILDRNKLLETVSRLTAEVDKDVRQRYADNQKKPPPQKPYEERGLEERVVEDGLGYASYHRLRVAAVTRNLADIIGRASGFDVDSDECQAIRWLIEKWRDATFAEEPEGESKPFGSEGDAFPADGEVRPRSSQNSFLSSFDIDYRLRRIFFLQRRIGELLRAGSRTGVAAGGARFESILVASFSSLVDEEKKARAFREELRRIKAVLAEPLGELVSAEGKLYENTEVAEMLTRCLLGQASVGESIAQKRQRATPILRSILKDPIQATVIFKTHEQEFDAIARKIATLLDESFTKARDYIDRLLPKLAPGESVPTPGTPEEAARIALLPIVAQFDSYDAVIFPIQYGTGATEANRVDIVRISPPDARQLIDERKDPKGRRKLAGTAVFSFGAFLARFWRENDMLWGRLDAAEVLVRSLLHDTPAADEEGLVDRLVEEAHRTILSETLTRLQREELWNFISEAFAASSPERGKTPPSDKQLRIAVVDLLRNFPDLDQRLRTVLRFAGGEDDEELRRYFQTTYEVRRRLAVAGQLRTVARSGRIVSRMLNVLAIKRNVTVLKKHAALLPRVAAVVWGLVEISIPRSFGYLLWEGWRYRLYTVGVILLLAGFFWQPAAVAGLMVIGLTLFVDISRWWIGDLLRGTGRWKSPLTWGLILFALVVIILAGWKSVDLWLFVKAFFSR